MKRLVKGAINNLLVEYIECIENNYYDRKQTVIRKKTSFFIDNEEFYTLDDIEIRVEEIGWKNCVMQHRFDGYSYTY